MKSFAAPLAVTVALILVDSNAPAGGLLTTPTSGFKLATPRLQFQTRDMRYDYVVEVLWDRLSYHPHAEEEAWVWVEYGVYDRKATADAVAFEIEPDWRDVRVIEIMEDSLGEPLDLDGN